MAEVIHNVGIRGIRLQHVETRWAETEGDPLDLPAPGPGMVVTHTTLEGTLRVQECRAETPTVWVPRDTWVYAGQTALVPTEPEVGTRAQVLTLTFKAKEVDVEGAAAVESSFLWFVKPDCLTDRRYYARDCVTTLTEGEAIRFGPLGHETWEV